MRHRRGGNPRRDADRPARQVNRKKEGVLEALSFFLVRPTNLRPSRQMHVMRLFRQ
jgi:hypothetical protein